MTQPNNIRELLEERFRFCDNYLNAIRPQIRDFEATRELCTLALEKLQAIEQNAANIHDRMAFKAAAEKIINGMLELSKRHRQGSEMFPGHYENIDADITALERIKADVYKIEPVI